MKSNTFVNGLKLRKILSYIFLEIMRDVEKFLAIPIFKISISITKYEIWNVGQAKDFSHHL